MRIVKEVILDETVGTLAVMDYADKHPDEQFECTHFYERKYGNNPLTGLIVSDFSADDPLIWGDELCKPTEMPNGWERVTYMVCNEPMWYCRKNGRGLYISL